MVIEELDRFSLVICERQLSLGDCQCDSDMADLYHREENRKAKTSVGALPFDHIPSSLLSWNGESIVCFWVNA